MSRVITLPPENGLRPDGTVVGGWWRDADDDRILCEVCPRACHLKRGDRGFCFVRQNIDGEMVLTTYGRSTGFCIDPIEKKPLNHFLPGTAILSFGTAGCNLGCKFCQNWDISKSREVERLSESASPEAIAEAARQTGCRSVAFTYNDPVIWAEYAIDTAKACHAAGLHAVAVTAGYIMPEVRPVFYQHMDAANVDLKAFTEDFYRRITYSHLQPVLETLEWLKRESDVWFEITNLVIPQANDSMDEIREMSDWLLRHVGDDVPVHFTAFHPDFRMRDRPNTPHETLLAAREVALAQGLKFVYVGNVNDVVNQSTYCPQCSGLLIERNWYELGAYNLNGNRCRHCGAEIPGRFEQAPGTWGRKRLPVQMSRFARELPVISSTDRGTNMATETNVQSATTADEPQRPRLSGEQEQAIHRAACEIVAAEVARRRIGDIDSALAGAAQIPVLGSFVTLKRQERLRACCGFLGQQSSLAEAVRHAAKRTATEDVRLPPISTTELPYLDVDVTLLYEFQPVAARGESRKDAVTVGRHGLQIRRRDAAGLLLPSVATEHDLDAEGFLRQVCRKAGLPTTAWKEDDTQLWTFEGYAIPGPFAAEALSRNGGQPEFSDADIAQLAGHCRNNVVALLRGATPSYYLPGCADGTVHGLALSVRLPNSRQSPQFSRLSLRPGLPLQSTLFNLVEAAAKSLAAMRINLNGLEVDLTVLTDPAMHGSVGEPDLRGLDPQRRALVVMENNKVAWAFDPKKTPEQLLAATKTEAKVADPAVANLFSLAAYATNKPVTVSNTPKAQIGPLVRPPAVAGTFYPNDAGELSKMVDDMLARSDGQPEPWPAAMVPHAGLVYSGHIAADVLKRVTIPDTVIVIGPKHTRLGVEWAVSPHETWSIPGTTIASDADLARKLAETIPGLELDAAAHHQEHGVEVELPFLAKLVPDARVVGIALGGGNLDRCRQFATGLAEVIRGLDQPPLLVISSDMNHYATDAENRRLDEIAISSLETLDPGNVFQTVVTDHHISMCGVLPAVIVLEALRQLGKLGNSKRVAYSTSADVSGDTSRVVGYAGMLFG